MEAIVQTLLGLGPLKLIGGILFILLIIAMVKGASSPNNMPGGGKGDSTPASGTAATTPTQQPTQNQQPPQNKQ